LKDSTDKTGESEFELAAKAVASNTNTCVLVPVLKNPKLNKDSHTRTSLAKLDEAVGLAAAINLNVKLAEIVHLQSFNPSTLLGKGKLEEYKTLLEHESVKLVIVDHALSPVQQRNLERALSVKVMDRTGLILEIFGRRAKTREGALQVELAHLNYQKSRLVRSWTHLERQRGGVGFLGGPGETQIEADRRLLANKIAKLEKQLEDVRRTRGLHRQSREAMPHPTVALVGYTNAGKSSLFNVLTEADVMAKDLLFATLDPTVRKIHLPQGTNALLSDTVGFISELPTDLVAAFRATLEEVTEAALVLHIRDISHEDTQAQAQDVEAIMRDLEVDPESETVIQVWNKIDALPQDEQMALRNRDLKNVILTSAVTGEGLDILRQEIETRLTSNHSTQTVLVPAADGEGLAWLYQHTTVLDAKSLENGDTQVEVRASEKWLSKLNDRFQI
jgi:GTP-binding protein HflX